MKYKIMITFCLSAVLAIPLAHSQYARYTVSPYLHSGSPQQGTRDNVVAAPKGPVAPKYSSLTDHKAMIFNFEGHVKILRKNKDRWEALRRGTLIQEGDRIRTGKNGTLEIAYDDYFSSRIRINADTIVQFESIEPTRLALRKGSIYSQLSHSVSDAQYEVASPLALTATYDAEFYRAYNPENASDITLCLQGSIAAFPFPSENSLNSHSVPIAQGQKLVIHPEEKFTSRQIRLRKLTNRDKRFLSRQSDKIDNGLVFYLETRYGKEALENAFNNPQKA